jgi:hypothetical protein
MIPVANPDRDRDFSRRALDWLLVIFHERAGVNRHGREVTRFVKGKIKCVNGTRGMAKGIYAAYIVENLSSIR